MPLPDDLSNSGPTPSDGVSQGRAVVIRGARVLTAAGRDYARASVVIRDGKIAAVGERVRVPEGAETIDAQGKVVTPGFLDAHTHLGIHEEGLGSEGNDTNEMTDPVTAHVRALDAINPEELGLREAAAHGVTCAVVLPGSGNVVGGLGVAVKTYGRIVDRMVVRDPVGLKVAFGENPKRVYGGQKKMPSTRMGTAAVLREALTRAQTYLRKADLGRENPDKLPDRDLRLEALGLALRGEMPVLAHCHRMDDILTALRIAEEFGLRIVLEHATEAHRMADVLAERKAPCVVGPTFGARTKVETREKTFQTPGILARAGVPVAICSDHPVTPSAFLRLYAALAVSEGMDEADALRAITSWPAQIMGVAERVGSLEPGKDADLTIWSGDPLDIRSRAEQVFVDGVRVPPVPSGDLGVLDL
jgi:imidazolonepropionase-like amidohydrolase